ncbi:MAG: TonB C-terminal domain-containing protein [Desulfobulbaceae bacterium]|nr:TonB C-terminal domain-containing protein [Desulfobulbaceae bacterium]
MKQKKALTLIVCGVAAVLLSITLFSILLVIKDKPEKRKRQMQMVTLVKPPPPPPPPEVEEPPPEPEEEIIDEPEPEEQPQEEVAEDTSDEPPPGEQLGLDAEGGSGTDGFGLVGKKGGRSLIGGGATSLLRRFAWYTRIVQEELQETIKKFMHDNGGIPSDNLKTIVVITLDDQGRVIAHSLVGKSGNSDLDRAVNTVLGNIYLSEPPPAEMPRKIKLQISLKG